MRGTPSTSTCGRSVCRPARSTSPACIALTEHTRGNHDYDRVRSTNVTLHASSCHHDACHGAPQTLNMHISVGGHVFQLELRNGTVQVYTRLCSSHADVPNRWHAEPPKFLTLATPHELPLSQCPNVRWLLKAAWQSAIYAVPSAHSCTCVPALASEIAGRTCERPNPARLLQTLFKSQ